MYILTASVVFIVLIEYLLLRKCCTFPETVRSPAIISRNCFFFAGFLFDGFVFACLHLPFPLDFPRGFSACF